LEPLGMTDTDFSVSPERADRLAALYWAHPSEQGQMVLATPGGAVVGSPACLSGGGGLHGTAGDYHRFASMLRGGCALGEVRLLAPRTVEFMASNHLPANADLADFGRPLFAETPFRGVGFGLGVSVTIDPVSGKALGSVGDFGWGGAASTAFWVDPVEDLTVLFFTQLAPSNTYPIRSQLKALVSQAVVGP
jgi:CubicO group peptidase (beta-lactamase class C family)